jgi:hypothetical protein
VTERPSTRRHYLQTISKPQNAVRLALIQELTAAVDARAHAHQQRQHAPNWKRRIDEREAESVRCIEVLDVQTQLLISDAVTLAETRAALERIKYVIKSAASQRHREFDQPAHRPSERAFRDACRAAMKRHRVDAKTAARIIVEKIAPTLSDGARADLLGPWRTRQSQVDHLADLLHRTR